MIEDLSYHQRLKLAKATSVRWNSMRAMRAVMGMPDTIDSLMEFLVYWETLSLEQHIQLRTMDLEKEWESCNLPRPNL